MASHMHNNNCPCITLKNFPKSSLFCENAIGQGGFGNVISGKLNGKNVVVKILHSPIGKKRFETLEEMAKLQHRNLVTFMGIIDTDPIECPQLVFQPVSDGNLLEFVKSRTNPYSEKTLQKFACDIINGMEYLHNKDFIHGCLSARNILLDSFQSFLNAKISDYGIYRVLDGLGSNYYKESGKMYPIRWMPKEVLRYEKNIPRVTKSADIWGFGVILWEMWTKGEIPYGAAVSNTEVRQHILNGSSPLAFHRPARCPKEVINVMEHTFKVNENQRPTFVDLKKTFESIEVYTDKKDDRKPATLQHRQPQRDIRKEGKAGEKLHQPYLHRDKIPGRGLEKPSRPNNSGHTVRPQSQSRGTGRGSHMTKPSFHEKKHRDQMVHTNSRLMSPKPLFPVPNPKHPVIRPTGNGLLPFPYDDANSAPPPYSTAIAEPSNSEAENKRAQLEQTVSDLQKQIEVMRLEQLKQKQIEKTQGEFNIGRPDDGFVIHHNSGIRNNQRSSGNVNRPGNSRQPQNESPRNKEACCIS